MEIFKPYLFKKKITKLEFESKFLTISWGCFFGRLNYKQRYKYANYTSICFRRYLCNLYTRRKSACTHNYRHIHAHTAQVGWISNSSHLSSVLVAGLRLIRSFTNKVRNTICPNFACTFINPKDSLLSPSIFYT